MFDVKTELNGFNLNDAKEKVIKLAINKYKYQAGEKLKEVSCDFHKEPISLVFNKASSSNFTISVKGCCKVLEEKAMKALKNGKK